MNARNGWSQPPGWGPPHQTGWAPLVDHGPLPLQTARSVGRWLWPTLAVSGFLARDRLRPWPRRPHPRPVAARPAHHRPGRRRGHPAHRPPHRRPRPPGPGPVRVRGRVPAGRAGRHHRRHPRPGPRQRRARRPAPPATSGPRWSRPSTASATGSANGGTGPATRPTAAPSPPPPPRPRPGLAPPPPVPLDQEAAVTLQVRRPQPPRPGHHHRRGRPHLRRGRGVVRDQLRRPVRLRPRHRPLLRAPHPPVAAAAGWRVHRRPTRRHLGRHPPRLPRLAHPDHAPHRRPDRLVQPPTRRHRPRPPPGRRPAPGADDAGLRDRRADRPLGHAALGKPLGPIAPPPADGMLAGPVPGAVWRSDGTGWNLPPNGSPNGWPQSPTGRFQQATTFRKTHTTDKPV